MRTLKIGLTLAVCGAVLPLTACSSADGNGTNIPNRGFYVSSLSCPDDTNDILCTLTNHESYTGYNDLARGYGLVTMYLPSDTEAKAIIGYSPYGPACAVEFTASFKGSDLISGALLERYTNDLTKLPRIADFNDADVKAVRQFLTDHADECR